MNTFKHFTKYVSLFIFLHIFTIQISAQNTGLILEDETYNQEKRLSVGSKFSELPLKKSLKKYCPEIQNQGAIGSCVGWASGYGAFTIMRAIAEENTDKADITANAYSALFIYNQVKIGDCSQGSLFSKALQLLKDEGDCPSNEFDFPKESCERKPTSDIKSMAKTSSFEVKDYFTLFSSTEKSQQKILKTKTSLSENKPVIIGMLIRENFKFVGSEERYWDPESGNKENAGGHAMVVVGYDDGKRAFLIMNSWGKEWGKNGYVWVKYDDFGKYCVYAYQLHVGKRKNKRSAAIVNNTTTTEPNETTSSETADPLTLAANFAFRYPSWDDDEDSDEIKFDYANAKFNGAFYTLEKTDWETPQPFQLVTKDITKDKYVYVFSIDADNTPHIHWPRNEKYAQKFNQINEGALVPYNDVEIVVPGKDRALIKNKKGEDYLFVLYSDEEIDDLVERVEQIVADSGEYINRLNNAFGERLVPTEDIEYQQDKMYFESTSNSNGYIIPILLKVESK